MNNSKPIIIYTWKDSKLNQNHPKVILKSMLPGGTTELYDPDENVKNICRLFAESLPGNTIDKFYQTIADEILPLLESEENIEILKSPYDLSNRIRIAINIAIEGDNKS